eukprot:SAG31_NODE_1235_length_9198_cov_5.065282_2_plen_259_part_00
MHGHVVHDTDGIELAPPPLFFLVLLDARDVTKAIAAMPRHPHMRWPKRIRRLSVGSIALRRAMQTNDFASAPAASGGSSRKATPSSVKGGVCKRGARNSRTPTAATVAQDACTQCRKAGQWRTCKRCGQVAYCSTGCQRLGWPEHSVVCRAPVQAVAVGAAGAAADVSQTVSKEAAEIEAALVVKERSAWEAAVTAIGKATEVSHLDINLHDRQNRTVPALSFCIVLHTSMSPLGKSTKGPLGAYVLAFETNLTGFYC